MRYDNVNDLPADSKAAEHQNGDFYRSILESTDQGYCTIEVAFDENEKPVDYRFLEVSRSFERQTGIKNGAGRSMREIAPDQDQFWFDIYGRVALTGEPERFENFSTPLDRWWSVYAFKIDGPARIAVLFDDITDRKRAAAALRASEERFRCFVTASADVVYRMSPDWSQMRHLDGQGFISKTPEPSDQWMDRYILPEDRVSVQKAIARAIRTKSEFDLEHRVIRADGTPGWTKSRAIPMLDEHGKITEWLGTASDVTQAKAAREVQSKTETKFAALFDNMAEGFSLFGVVRGSDGQIIDLIYREANKALEHQTGFDRAKIIGQPLTAILSPSDAARFIPALARVIDPGEPTTVEEYSEVVDRWFEVSAYPHGQDEVVAFYRDISERKRAEAALRTSEEQFESLLNQAPLGVYLVDGDFVIRQVNPVALPVFGDIPGGAVGRDFDEVIHILWDKEYANELISTFRHTLETGEPYVTPERAEYRVDRDIIEYYEWQLDRILLAGGQYGVVCYFRDISAQVQARKEIEEAREFTRQSEERLRLALDAAAVGTFIWYPQEDRGVPDARMLELFGQPPGGTLDLASALASAIHPGDQDRYGAAVTRALDPKGDGMLDEEIRLVLPDGDRRWVAIRARTQFQGVPLSAMRMPGTALDITVRKQAEAALRESEERQAFLLKLSDAVRPLANPNEVQAAASRLLGEHLKADRATYYEIDSDGVASTLHGYSTSATILPENIPIADFGQQWLDSYRQGANVVVSDIATDMRFSDEERAAWRAIDMNGVLGVPLVKDGRLCAVLGLITAQPRHWTDGDIALVEEVAERTWAAVERSRAEASRVKADQGYSRLFEASPAPFLVLATDAPRFTITEVNDAYLAATMRTREDLVGRALFDAFPDNPNEPASTSGSNLRASLERVLASRQPDKLPGLKYDIARPDGTFEERWWSPVNSPILNEDGEVEAIIHNANDVTEDRHADALLRESEARYRALFDTIDEGFCVIEFIDGPNGPLSDYVHVEANPAYTANAGIPDIVGKRLREIVSESEANAWAEIYRRVLVTGEPVRFERELVETGRHLDLSAFRVEPASRRQVAVLFQDISDRTRADVVLRESESRAQLLLAELQHRVRNILTMVRSVVRRTGENCEDVDDYVRHLDGRLGSLARVQAILTRESGRGVDLHGMVFNELKSQGALPAQYVIKGPEVELSPKAAEVLGLAVHELATNSTKYGVLSESLGTIRIRWAVEQRGGRAWLRFTWHEPVDSNIDRPSRIGFGTDLIVNRVPYELRGTGHLLIDDKQVEAKIDFPLSSGPSKLEIVASNTDISQ